MHLQYTSRLALGFWQSLSYEQWSIIMQTYVYLQFTQLLHCTQPTELAEVVPSGLGLLGSGQFTLWFLLELLY